MQLLSIADLARPAHELAPLIQEAQYLKRLYDKFLSEDFDTYSYEVVDHGEKSRRPGFHASEMSGCLRRLTYTRWGTEKRHNGVDVDMKRRFRMGTAVHAMVQNDFKRMAATTFGRVLFEEEARVSPERQELAAYWGIESSCDGIFTFQRWYEPHGMWYPYMRVGLEIKTQSDPEFAKTKQPVEDHRDQTCLYMKCLDVPLLWVLYYNKSNSNITEPSTPWLFSFDQERWRKHEQKMTTVLGYINQGNLPAKEEGRPCGWCPYAWHCQPSILSKPKNTYMPNVSAGMLNRNNRR